MATPTITFQKDPEAILDYDFSWVRWLATGETITSHTVTVPTGLTLAAHAEADGVVTAWLAGGTANTMYRVECLITTSEGRTDERSFLLRVTER